MSERSKPTVLIVDDDDDLRQAVRMLLRHEGFEVVGEAINGSEASIAAGQLQPDFITLDYLMPGMTAEETAAIIRKVAPDSKLVALSGVLNEKPSWADGFLSKKDLLDTAPLLRKIATQVTDQDLVSSD